MQSIRYPEKTPLGTEDDAWVFLDWLRQQPADSVLEGLELKAPSWARLGLHYDGADYDATMTASMMEALLTLQSGLHRTYALAKYGDEKASRLTSQDKSNTEILVKVRPGTTGLEVDGTKIVNHFLDVVGHSMNGTEATAVAITAIVLFFGYSSTKLIVNMLGKNKAALIEAEEKGAERADRASARAEDVRQTIALSQEETKRTEILAGITEQFSKVGIVQNEALRVVESVLKSVSRTDRVDIQGLPVPGPVASDILTNPRASAELITLKSNFQIMSVDGSARDGFRARLKNISSDDLFNATLKDTFLSEKEGETVQEAFWKKRLVYLELDARLLRGQVKDAEILKARILDQEAPDPKV